MLIRVLRIQPLVQLNVASSFENPAIGTVKCCFEFWESSHSYADAVSCAWNISIYSIITDGFSGWRICELYV